MSRRTIHTRVYRGSVLSKHRGSKSPLEQVETALVQICIQMGKIRQPLNCTEAIQLMNNLICNTDTQAKLAEFQKSRKLGDDDFKYGTVTKAWWRGFLRRHEHEIVTKRGEKFALNRSDWTTLPNIKQMYEVIYDEMVDAGVAIELQTPIFTDIDGNPVDEAERFGMKQKIKITKPGWILFADESGFSTAQKKDGHVGGQRYIVEIGTVPQTIASTTDHKFTLLPFTSASGEAVCCVVIFQGKQSEVPATWRTGVDLTVTPILTANGNKIDMDIKIWRRKVLSRRANMQVQWQSCGLSHLHL